MRQALFVVALTASLLGSPAGPPVLFGPLWSLFSSIWSGSVPPVPPAPDAGCGWDPNGRCAPAVRPATDAGCGADPDGCSKGS